MLVVFSGAHISKLHQFFLLWGLSLSELMSILETFLWNMNVVLLEINLEIIWFCEHLFVGRIWNGHFLSMDVYGLMLKSAAEEYCTLFPFFSLVFQFHVCATFFKFLSISFSWIYALDSIQIFELPLSQIKVVYVKFWACCSGFTITILRYCELVPSVGTVD